MTKVTTPFTAQERVILFCTAAGISHAAVGISAHAMQSMAIPGFILHDRVIGRRKFFDVSFSSQPYNFEVAQFYPKLGHYTASKLLPCVLLECLENYGRATTALLVPHAVQLICDCDWRLS